MHPLLLPGTHLLRRGHGALQLGLDRRTALVVDEPPSPAGARVSRERAAAEAALGASPARRAALVVHDDRDLRAALPPLDATDPWPRHAVAALARRSPADLPAALAHRTRRVVVPRPFGHPLSQVLVEDLTRLCRRAGLRVPSRARPGPPARDAVPDETVAVLVGIGEPARDLVDDWLREGVPHLLVRLTEGRAVVGPFVLPGATACLRCTDAYRTEEDPCWPLLVEQYARAVRGDRADGIPEPADPALAAVALGWAARELAAHAEGGRPLTLDRTLTLPADLSGVVAEDWSPHPQCGCGWC